jgi:hypothetical protein
MGTKKVIAICQSGGDFQSSNDGSLSYNGGEAYAVDLNEQTRLRDFKKELAETFHIGVQGMVLKYFLPGNKKTLITISKDKDLQRMVNFYGDSEQVEVFVMVEEVVPRNNVPASRSSRTTISEPVVITADPLNTMYCSELVHTDNAINTNFSDDFSLANGEHHRRAAMQWENTITGVDQRFRSFSEFREALHKFSIAHGFTYRYKKNDSHRVTVKCKSEDCPWRIYASRLATTQLVCIKKMCATHTCQGAPVKPGYRSTRGWVGNIIKEKLKVSPNYKPKDIASDIKREYGIHLNYSQAWRAKEIAREQLQGSYREAYNQLPLYCEKIIETNPGSHATFSTKDDSSFHRLFISFHASIVGFKRGCRPLIFLDSTPLNSKYQGMLLAATAADGDDGVFPVAFAVVDDETDENWLWFLTELKTAVMPSCQITFVADSEKGIKESLEEVFAGQCFHAYCLRYLADKLNKDLKGQFSHEARRLMVQDFYAAAYSPKRQGFDQCVDNIKAISPDAYNWIIDSDPHHWANCFIDGGRYNHMSSNFGELFYSWVADANELPITQMVDVLRGKMMELFYTRRIESEQWVTKLTPSMEEKLEKANSKARTLKVQLTQHGSTFEVQGENYESELVDFDHLQCTCKVWSITGLPCCHALAVFALLGANRYEFCNTILNVDNYRLTYAESIQPVPNVEKPMEDEPLPATITVTPPPTRRPPGRPKNKQSAAAEIMKRQLQCSKCKGLGHNKKTCSLRILDPASDPLLLSGNIIEEIS